MRDMAPLKVLGNRGGWGRDGMALWVSQRPNEYDKEKREDCEENVESEAQVFSPSARQKWPNCSSRAFKRALIAGDSKR